MATPAERVEQARQRWNAGDLPGYLAVYAEDIRYHGVEPEPMDKPTVAGEHRGDFRGVPATGRPYVLEGITIMRFRDGQVVERWASADFLGLMVQLVAVPAPA